MLSRVEQFYPSLTWGQGDDAPRGVLVDDGLTQTLSGPLSSLDSTCGEDLGRSRTDEKSVRSEHTDAPFVFDVHHDHILG